MPSWRVSKVAAKVSKRSRAFQCMTLFRLSDSSCSPLDNVFYMVHCSQRNIGSILYICKSWGPALWQVLPDIPWCLPILHFIAAGFRMKDKQSCYKQNKYSLVMLTHDAHRELMHEISSTRQQRMQPWGWTSCKPKDQSTLLCHSLRLESYIWHMHTSVRSSTTLSPNYIALSTKLKRIDLVIFGNEIIDQYFLEDWTSNVGKCRVTRHTTA